MPRKSKINKNKKRSYKRRRTMKRGGQCGNSLQQTVVPLNRYNGPDPLAPNVLISARNLPNMAGGRKSRRQKNQRGGQISPFYVDPILGMRSNLNSQTAFGTTTGSLWNSNTLNGLGNDLGPKYNFTRAPVFMV
jgi:hypothetical protein